MDKKKPVSLILIMLYVIMIILLPISVHAWQTPILQSWWLADSGKHLDWGGSTTYQVQFNTAVATWNNYKNGVIRQDSIFTIEDVTLSDVNNGANNIYATTYSSRKIQFNTGMMNNRTMQQITNTCLHELGHALGLDHRSESNTIMYNYGTSLTSLSAEDKISYDYSYTRF